jgi:hypothetical protein
MKVEAEAGVREGAGEFGWHHDPRPDVGSEGRSISGEEATWR